MKSEEVQSQSEAKSQADSRERHSRTKFRREWFKRLSRLVVTGHWIKYRGIRKQFVPGIHSDTRMGLREVCCGISAPIRGNKYPIRATVCDANRLYTGVPQPPVPQTKAVSPRRVSSREEKAVSAFLSETLALTAPTATPEDWERVQAAKPKATRKSPRKKLLKPGHFTGQC